MKKVYVASEFSTIEGVYHVQCNDLVGTGRNWIEPARILDITPSELVLMLKNNFNATLVPYKKDGKIAWIGYYWTTLAEARKWKNFINAKARAEKHTI